MQRPPASPPPLPSLIGQVQVETPEHVVLQYDLAGVGSRISAALLDHLILLGWVLACAVLAAWTRGAMGRMTGPVWIALATIGWLGYFTLFEAFREGQTPGKRALGIRVVRETGHGLDFGSAFARNLLRAADFVPPPYLTGLLLIMLHPRSRRLGDMVGGTIVVRDRPEPAIAPIAAKVVTAPLQAAAGHSLDDRAWLLLAAWHDRVGELAPDAAERITAQLAGRFAEAYPVRPADDRTFLLGLYQSERSRRAANARSTTGAPSEGRTAARLRERHEDRWRGFEELAGRAAREGLDDLSAAELPDFAARYREVVADLARARTYRAEPATLQRLERLAAAGHNQLYRAESRTSARIAQVILCECPAAVWRARRAVGLALLCLFGPAAGAFVLLREKPELAYEVLPDVMLDRAAAGHARQEDDLGYVEIDAEDRPQMAVQLISNNVRVSFNCFAGGIFLGVGSLYVLAYNGLMLGASAGHYANVGLLKYLLTFIIGHGVLELFAIAVSGAAGFLLGLAVIAPGDLTRSEALVTQGRLAIRMVGVVVVLLMLAGMIEGLASTSGASFAYRVAVSSASAVFLLLYLANGARWAGTLDAP